MPNITAEDFIEKVHQSLYESSTNKKNNKLNENIDPFDALRIISTYGSDDNFYSNVELIGSVLDNTYLTQIDYDAAVGALEAISNASEDHEFTNSISQIRAELENKLIDNYDGSNSGTFERSDDASVIEIRKSLEFLRNQEPTEDEFLALNAIDDALVDYEAAGNFDSSTLESAFYILNAGKCGDPSIDSEVDKLISNVKELGNYGNFITSGIIEESNKNKSKNILNEDTNSETIVYLILPRKRFSQNVINDEAFEANFDDMTLANNYSAPYNDLEKHIAERVKEDMDEMGPKGLAAYIHENSPLYGKVESIILEYRPWKDNQEEGLYIITTFKPGVDAKSLEESLKSYIQGQMSDGWGEGFEQREFEAGNVWIVYDEDDESDLECFSNERDAINSYNSKNEEENNYEGDPDDEEEYEPHSYNWDKVDVEVYVSFYPSRYGLGGRITQTWINGYNERGLDLNGYDKEGFDRFGRDKAGYDRSGFNAKGLDRNGFNKEGFDVDGYDKDGYNKDGLDRKGFDRDHHATVQNFLKLDPLQDLHHGYDYYKR